jgi:hypothetical protein
MHHNSHDGRRLCKGRRAFRCCAEFHLVGDPEPPIVADLNPKFCSGRMSVEQVAINSQAKSLAIAASSGHVIFADEELQLVFTIVWHLEQENGNIK